MAKGMNTQKATKKAPTKTPKEKKEEKRKKEKRLRIDSLFLYYLLGTRYKVPCTMYPDSGRPTYRRQARSLRSII